MGKVRTTNAKPGKNALVFSVEGKGRKPSGMEVLDGSKFVREKNFLPFGLPGLFN